MENKHRLENPDFSFASNTFTVGKDHVWDIVRKLKILTYKKALSVVEEHFGNMATFFYGNSESTPGGSAKNIIMKGEALAGGAKKHYSNFMQDALAELQKRDFSELARKMEIYPQEDGYMLILPFALNEVYPPVSHQIEKAKMNAGLISLQEFREKHVTFDISELKRTTIENMSGLGFNSQFKHEKDNNMFFSVYLLDQSEVNRAVSEAIGSVYGHLYEYHKGKEVAEVIGKKKELIGTLKNLLNEIDFNDLDISPKDDKGDFDFESTVEEAKAAAVKFIPGEKEPKSDPVFQDIKKNWGIDRSVTENKGTGYAEKDTD